MAEYSIAGRTSQLTINTSSFELRALTALRVREIGITAVAATARLRVLDRVSTGSPSVRRPDGVLPAGGWCVRWWGELPGRSPGRAPGPLGPDDVGAQGPEAVRVGDADAAAASDDAEEAESLPCRR